MAGRHEPQPDLAQLDGLAMGQRLPAAARLVAQAQRHDLESLARGDHRAVAGPGMVGMAVGDHGAIDRPQGIDEESARTDEQALRADLEPGRRVRRHQRGQCSKRNSGL